MLIKESTLRRIIKEEARRVLREAVTTYEPTQIEAQLKAIAATKGIGPNPLSNYQLNWGKAQTKINKMGATLEGIAGYGGIPAVWAQIYRGGALNPRAATALQTMQALPKESSDLGKARAVLRSLSSGQAFTGRPVARGSLGNYPDYDTDPSVVDRVNQAIGAVGAKELLENIKYVISFDLAGAMLPAAAAPAAAAPAAAAPAPMDWVSYVAKTRGGDGVKVAWEAYASSKGVKSDFGSFARWWQAYKKSNPTTFKGTVDETIAALKLTTAPAAASAAPVKPGTAAAPR